jgi:hypothetical protein
VSFTTPSDTFVLHGGNRPRLRNRAIILIGIAVVALVVLINAFQQPTSDNSGSVGHIVIPAAIAIGCLAGTILTLSQWWEDNTYFTIEGDRLAVRHGGGRGRPAWLEREVPIELSAEGASGSRSFFVTQGDARVRLGDVDPHQLDAWLRGRGFTVQRR